MDELLFKPTPPPVIFSVLGNIFKADIEERENKPVYHRVYIVAPTDKTYASKPLPDAVCEESFEGGIQ